MPPPSNQRADIEPPEELTSVAAEGFMTGVFRFGSVSILAHMIMNLPHPFVFSAPTPPSTKTHPPSHPKPRLSIFSREHIRARLFHRPLEGFSEWVSPASRVYRGLTPQFKVFLQIAAMTLGGCIWAERRVADYIELMRRIKRAERYQAERANNHRP